MAIESDATGRLRATPDWHDFATKILVPLSAAAETDSIPIEGSLTAKTLADHLDTTERRFLQ